MVAYQPYTGGFQQQPGSTVYPTQLGASTSTGTSFGTTQASPVDTLDAQLSRAISGLAEQYGTQIFNWANSQIKPNTALTNDIVGNFQDAAAQDFQLANTANTDYNNIGRPALAQLSNEAGSYSSKARQQFAAGQAEAASMQGSDAGIAAANQSLQAYGINPNSGISVEAQQAQRAAAGAAAAAAGVGATQNVQATGRQLQAQNVAAEQQLPGQIVNASTAGQGALTGAANTQFGNTSTQANAFGAATPMFQVAQNISPEGTQSSGTQGSTQSSTSNNVGSTIFSGVQGGGAGGFLAEGGAIPDNATTGGFVSRNLSNSRGAVTDDVPAKLNAGEFVIPKDVTQWYGHKHFQDMIMKARKAAGSDKSAPAKPSFHQAASGGAIPTGW